MLTFKQKYLFAKDYFSLITKLSFGLYILNNILKHL